MNETRVTGRPPRLLEQPATPADMPAPADPPDLTTSPSLSAPSPLPGPVRFDEMEQAVQQWSGATAAVLLRAVPVLTRIPGMGSMLSRAIGATFLAGLHRLSEPEARLMLEATAWQLGYWAGYRDESPPIIPELEVIARKMLE